MLKTKIILIKDYEKKRNKQYTECQEEYLP